MTFGAGQLGATQLGASSGSAALRIASGFSSTQHGSHTSAFRQIVDAVGATPSTTFGAANVYPGYVPGLGAITQFGTPGGPQQWLHVNAGPLTVIPRAYYAFDQTAAASGRMATTFGTPLGRRRTSGGGTLCRAVGFAPVTFGLPSAAWRQRCDAAGFASTTFGTPTYTRGGARIATGFSRTKFGKPKGLARLGVRYASGASSTAFGTPTGRINNRAAALAPTSTFGTPLLNRSTTC